MQDTKCFFFRFFAGILAGFGLLPVAEARDYVWKITTGSPLYVSEAQLWRNPGTHFSIHSEYVDGLVSREAPTYNQNQTVVTWETAGTMQVRPDKRDFRAGLLFRAGQVQVTTDNEAVGDQPQYDREELRQEEQEVAPFIWMPVGVNWSLSYRLHDVHVKGEHKYTAGGIAFRSPRFKGAYRVGSAGIMWADPTREVTLSWRPGVRLENTRGRTIKPATLKIGARMEWIDGHLAEVLVEHRQRHWYYETDKSQMVYTMGWEWMMTGQNKYGLWGVWQPSSARSAADITPDNMEKRSLRFALRRNFENKGFFSAGLRLTTGSGTLRTEDRREVFDSMVGAVVLAVVQRI